MRQATYAPAGQRRLKIVYFLLASWTPLGILMDAMITKYTVEAFTEGLALAMVFSVFSLYFFLTLRKSLRSKARRAKAKR